MNKAHYLLSLAADIQLLGRFMERPGQLLGRSMERPYDYAASMLWARFVSTLTPGPIVEVKTIRRM